MLGILLIFGSIAQGAADGMSLDTILHSHQEYLDRIHTVDATIEFWESMDRGATWTLTMRYHWLKDGPRERATIWANGYVDEGGVRREQEVRYDTSYAPDETRILQRWNAENPPSEPPSPANQYHRAAAQIAGPVREGTISRQPPFYLMLAPTFDDYLPSAIRSGSSVSLARTTLDGKPAFEIRFDTKVGIPASYRATLDPSRGFAMVRHEARSRAGIGVSEAVELREVEDDLFIPVRIRQTSPGQPDRVYERRVTQLKLNEPVAADALVINFPEGMQVSDTRTFPRIVSIWGTDGPKRVFKTPQEYWDYEKSFWRRQPTNTGRWFVGVAAATIVAVIVLMTIRRRIGRRA